jgi:Hydrophobic surface binding protein A
MQIKRFFTFALVGAASASVISDAIATINKSIVAMDTQILAWDGTDIQKAADILTSAQGLLDVIKKAAVDSKGSPDLPLTEAVGILQPANVLVKSTESVMKNLSERKAKLASVDKGFVGVVGKTLKDFKDAAGDLLKEIKAKLPANVKSVSDTIGKNINKALDTGITAYSS